MADVFLISAGFDQTTYEQIKQFSNFHPILEEELLKAHEAADSYLQVTAKGFMPWGPGPLMDSLDINVIDPYHSEMGTDVIYARRRNWGFSGMTDSLGRFFPNDPGALYMDQTVDTGRFKVGDIFETALEATLARLGVRGQSFAGAPPGGTP